MSEAPVVASKPPVLLALGWGGLLPFIALSMLAWLAPAPAEWVLRCFLTYSLGIVCFLAGTLWGTARDLTGAEKTLRLLASNLFVLLAVGAVVFASPLLAALVLLLDFALILALEWCSASLRGWYLRYRLQLTLVAVVCHLLFILALL